MTIILLALLLLSGCASQYPAVCDLKQADKQGAGYTVAKFPCALKHFEGAKAATNAEVGP